MKQYSLKYSDNKKKPIKYSIDFIIDDKIVSVIIKFNKESIKLGKVTRINDGFEFDYGKNENVDNVRNNHSLINVIHKWIENYYFNRDIYFPRVYLNTARALADSKLWVKLAGIFKDEEDFKNIELTQYTMTSLISGTAVFSYAAVESFVNDKLTTLLGIKEFRLIDTNVNTKSLIEKLKLLCDVMNINNKIADNRIWQDFIILDRVRNLFVHYKQDNMFDILYKYKEKISPGFLLNTGIDTIKFFYNEKGWTINDFLEGNLFTFTDIDVLLNKE